MKLFRISGDDVEMIPERSYRDREVGGLGEATLQKLLTDHPEVIPGEQMDPDDPPTFVVIKSEAGVTPGSMDILLIDQKGIPTVIEAKLVDNREMRRMVLAQGVEYLAHVQAEWTPQMMLEEGQKFWDERGGNFDTSVEERLGISFEAGFLEAIAANLRENKLRLIIAADRIPPELRRVIEFLNTASNFDVYGLEVRFFSSGDGRALILAPQLVGLTGQKSEPAAARWNRQRFFASLAENASSQDVAVAEDLIAFGVDVSGRAVDWGTGKGRGSLTARLVLTTDRFSLFSVYTTGEFSLNIGWSHERLDRLSPGLSEEYRAMAKSKLSLDFSRDSWERGWPMAGLSSLVPDQARAFKEVVSQFASEVRDLLGHAESGA